LLTFEDQKELSFEFENAITEVLAWKLINAAEEHNLKTVILA
jgi:tRNA A37 threonylcarbamoyltransferase TsaD